MILTTKGIKPHVYAPDCSLKRRKIDCGMDCHYMEFIKTPAPHDPYTYPRGYSTQALACSGGPNHKIHRVTP